jgi:hypothetical protein
MRSCSQCGAVLNEGTELCWACGAPAESAGDLLLSAGTSEKAQPASEVTPAATPTMLDAADTQTDVQRVAVDAVAEEQPLPSTDGVSPSPAAIPLEQLLALEGQLSRLMDEHDTPNWTINPANHPDVNAFIQGHAGDEFFVRKALALQANRAKYYDTMRSRAAASRAEIAARPFAAVRRWLRRLLKWTLLLLMLVVCLVLGASAYFHFEGDRRLQEAIAQADEKDPDWRWDDLEAKRAAVPDDQNAAWKVELAALALPEDWPAAKASFREIRDLPPVIQLSEVHTNALAREFAARVDALGQARDLADYPAGRYRTRTTMELFSRRSPRQQQTASVSDLLWFFAAHLAQYKSWDEALATSRAILNTGRAYGDEPDLSAQLARMACQYSAWTSIERTLAQGNPSTAALAATQKLLEDELQQPLLLYALRGHRAQSHQVMLLLEANDIRQLHPEDSDKALAVAASESAVGRVEHWLKLGWIKDNHARMLEWMNRAVEHSSLPVEEQSARFPELLEAYVAIKNEFLAGLRSPLATPPLVPMLTAAKVFHRRQAELRCAVAVLAAERYRWAHGRWPETLSDLVPEYIAAVPLDPFDGKPLRMGVLSDGLVIYSVGPDEQDNGGDLADRKDPDYNGTDLGFRLWNVQQRRQAPSPELLPMPAELPPGHREAPIGAEALPMPAELPPRPARR